MDTRNKIFRYISDFSEVPIDQLSDETDIVTEINWSDRHEDERLDALLDEFISKFKICIPKQDFKNFAMEKNIPKILYPVFYFIFVLKYREQIEVQHLTIKEMVNIADTGVWNI